MNNSSFIFFRTVDSLSQIFSSFLYLFLSIKMMNLAHCTGVKIFLITSTSSSRSALFTSIFFLVLSRSSIKDRRMSFCSENSALLETISFFCSSESPRLSKSYLNHNYYSFPSELKRCFPSEAVHIMYLCNAGNEIFTICLKYSFSVFTLYLPFAPILYYITIILPLDYLICN